MSLRFVFHRNRGDLTHSSSALLFLDIFPFHFFSSTTEFFECRQANKVAYIAAVQRYKRDEFAPQIEAIRAGLGTACTLLIVLGRVFMPGL